MIMLALMTAPYVAALILNGASRRQYDLRAAAAIGLGILFVFAGIGHFVQTELMAMMLPERIPGRVPLVYLTGVLEFVIAAGFFLPQHRQLAGWAAAAILVLFFPANVYAAINQVPMGGHAWGAVYLLVRAPLQIIILFWVYWFTIRARA